jgi:hypothetical protein
MLLARDVEAEPVSHLVFYGGVNTHEEQDNVSSLQILFISKPGCLAKHDNLPAPRQQLLGCRTYQLS